MQARQQLLERARLREIARIAVEHEAGTGIVLAQALFEHAQHDVVGNEVAGFHDRLGLEAERRAGSDGAAQQVAGGNVGNLQMLAEAGRLRALARTGRAEKYQSHWDFLETKTHGAVFTPESRLGWL
jgi:hypothetical protein